MLRLSSGDGRPLRDFFKSLVDDRAAAGKPLSKPCVDALNRFCATSDNTLASIMASFNAPLSIWSNPLVDAATNANDFDLRNIRKERMSIYLGITPDALEQAGVKRLLNLFFSQLVTLNVKELPQKNPALKHQCLLLMDEFTAIGKVSILAKAVSYMAGYNLRLLPIIQAPSQLERVYGVEDARTFMTNHAMQIFFAPRENRDAKEYSEMLGYETVKSKSKSRQLGGKSAGGRSESESDQRRALLLPQEVKELGQKKQIIMLENVKPILCEKIHFFEDPLFVGRCNDLHRKIIRWPSPAVPKLEIEGLPPEFLREASSLSPCHLGGPTPPLKPYAERTR
jgi:type IV secretion system protein VirD4